MKSLRTLSIFFAFFTMAFPCPGEAGENPVLWYNKPAEDFVEALPIGNGRLGAMVYGGQEYDTIGLNHDRLWRRKYVNTLEPVWPHLDSLRTLTNAGKWQEADRLFNQTFNPRYSLWDGSPAEKGDINPYIAAGDIVFIFPHKDTVVNYRRDLDLSTGVASVSYDAGGVRIHREYFCVEDPSVVVSHVASNHSGSVAFDITVSRERKTQISKSGPVIPGVGYVTERGLDPECTSEVRISENTIIFTGRYPEGVSWTIMARIISRGGKVQATDSRTIRVTGADEAWVITAISTDTENHDHIARCARDIDAALSKLELLHDSAVAAHSRYFGRVRLELGNDSERSNSESTDKLVMRSREKPDASLLELLFHYGRYLLIASSRPGNMPANLQGIWCEDYAPVWDSDYHLDINLEMCYWPAEICNLSELSKPLFDLTESFIPGARESAKAIYNCKGVLFPICTDPFNGGKVYGFGYSKWTGGGAWLAQHFWRHWKYTGDEEFLRTRVYPFLKDIAAFYLDFAKKAPDGTLTSFPAYSPEQGVRYSTGGTGSLCKMPTSDIALMREVFTHLLEASEHLKMDKKERAEWRQFLKHIPQYPVDKDGILCEFPPEFEKLELNHRHLSHLYPLFPGDEIVPGVSDPTLVEAFRRELVRRGNEMGGWATIQRACTWARLGDGDRALACFDRFLREQITPNLFGLYYSWDGTSKSPRPFQIESNFGACAAVAEMLIQSVSGEVRLLPALPSLWPDGKVSGLLAAGGFEVAMSWEKGKLAAAELRSQRGNPCRLRTKSPTAVLQNNIPVKVTQLSPTLVEFATQKGGVYTVAPIKQ